MANRKPKDQLDLDTPDGIRAVRTGLGLSQEGFASLIGISVATLRNWEQGRRTPDGPARVLLQVAARNPEAVFESVWSLDDDGRARTKGE